MYLLAWTGVPGRPAPPIPNLLPTCLWLWFCTSHSDVVYPLWSWTECCRARSPPCNWQCLKRIECFIHVKDKKKEFLFIIKFLYRQRIFYQLTWEDLFSLEEPFDLRRRLSPHIHIQMNGTTNLHSRRLQISPVDARRNYGKKSVVLGCMLYYIKELILTFLVFDGVSVWGFTGLWLPCLVDCDHPELDLLLLFQTFNGGDEFFLFPGAAVSSTALPPGELNRYSNMISR